MRFSVFALCAIVSVALPVLSAPVFVDDPVEVSDPVVTSDDDPVSSTNTPSTSDSSSSGSTTSSSSTIGAIQSGFDRLVGTGFRAGTSALLNDIFNRTVTDRDDKLYGRAETLIMLS